MYVHDKLSCLYTIGERENIISCGGNTLPYVHKNDDHFKLENLSEEIIMLRKKVLSSLKQ